MCSLCQKRQLHIDAYFPVTGRMLCVITHIRKDSKYHLDGDNRKQVKNVTKNIFSWITCRQNDFYSRLVLN